MVEEREFRVREYLATLLFKAKLKIDITSDISPLIPFLSSSKAPEDASFKSAKEYSIFLSSFSDDATLFSLLTSFLEEKRPNRKWRLPLIIERLVEVLDKQEDDHIFEGGIKKADIFIMSSSTSNYSKREISNPFLPLLLLQLSPSYKAFAAYPFSLFFEFECNEKKYNSIISKLEKAFKNTSDYNSVDEYTWMVKIQDEKGRSFKFLGNGTFFPFYSYFSIPKIPSFLGIKDIDQKDEVTNLSMEYSRLTLDKEEEILEKLDIKRESGLIKLEHHHKDKNLIIDFKDKSGIDKVLSEIDIYSFYPNWMDKDEYEKADENQPYVNTRYSLRFNTAMGRSFTWNGFFTSFDLPKKWNEVCYAMNEKIKYSDEMESLNPCLAEIGRTTDDTVFACDVVFSDYSKEYLYIAPDGSYYPGMKAVVPAGVNNTLRIVIIKNLRALSKEKDAEIISKCKRIVSHYPNKDNS